VDERVRDYQVFLDSVNENTRAVVFRDKLELSNLDGVTRIGFVYEMGTPMASTLLQNAELLKSTGVKNMDFLACDTLSDPTWKDFYSKLEGIRVGASSDRTGNIQYGGDWVMESTSEDVEGVYFTKSIDYYKYLLGFGEYSLMIKNGKLWGCGKNDKGQLGSDISTAISNFQQITTGYITKIATSFSSNFTILLDSEKNLWVCGNNEYAQLGFNFESNQSNHK
jgi:alpha-tubulin suppressor-like RCC1 family protein